MKKELAKLTEEERELLLDAPVMITLLLAAADNDFDKRERAQAKDLAQFEPLFPDTPQLYPFYTEVLQRFYSRLAYWMGEYPTLAELRNPIIAKQLEKINDIWPKLSTDFATSLYKSFLRWARLMAEASGGFFGYFTISPAERQWVDLPMLQHPSSLKS